MHIELNNKKLLNVVYLADVQQGFQDPKNLIIYLTNGTKIIDGPYSDESEAKAKLEEIKSLICK